MACSVTSCASSANRPSNRRPLELIARLIAQQQADLQCVAKPDLGQLGGCGADHVEVAGG
jgi:hypothetical protein